MLSRLCRPRSPRAALAPPELAPPARRVGRRGRQPLSLLDLLIVLIVLILTTALPALARSAPQKPPEPWNEAFNPDTAAVNKAAAEVSGEEGEPVVVLLTESRYSYDAAGRETFTHRVVYRILTAAAHESWSAVEERWSPWHQQRPRIRARVLTPDGLVHTLDPASLSESGEASQEADMFEDGRLLRAPLPATGPGAVVEEEVTIEESVPFFERGTVRYEEMGAKVAVRHARLILETSPDAPLRTVTRLLPKGKPRDEVVNGRRFLVFEYRDLPAEDDPEAGLPPDRPRTPYVAFSTGRSWSDIAKRYSDIVDDTIRGAKLDDLVRRAATPPASQIEMMNRLLARMSAEVRYTGVELGQGGLIPRSPGDTLRLKFGDCKDKAVLLVAALRALEIPAYVALLNAGADEADIEEGLPGMGAFDHAIVVVPGSPPIWIDPTDRFARAGELPVDDQGRLALVASPTATGLVHTPEAAATENREVTTRELFLADLGLARVVETTEYWGAVERDLRAYYTLTDPETVRQAISDHVSTAFLAKGVTATDHSDPFDLSRPFRLHVEAKGAGRGVTDLRNAAVAILPSTLLSRLPEEVTSTDSDSKSESPPEPRTADFYFDHPFVIEARYRVVPPAGFAAQPLPSSRLRRMGPATLSEEYGQDSSGAVTAHLKLSLDKRRISAAELAAMRQGVREIAESKPVLVLFEQVGEARLAEGKVREALGEFNRLAAASPKAALPRIRIARALLAGGLGEAARQEALAAVRLDPKLGVAQRTLGWVLEHDAVGRRFGKGFDRAGAIAAYRRAKQLDPTDDTARADLAILLEHDREGRRYARGADLTAAIDEYRSLRSERKSKEMDDNLLIALLRAGRFAEAQELAAGLEESNGHLALRLVADAAAAGPDAAVREAERKAPESAARLSVLVTAGQTLIHLRRYPEAAALFSRASQLAPNAASLLSLSDMLKRARRHEELTFDPKDPATPGRRLLVLLFTDNHDPKELRALLSQDVASHLGASDLRALEPGKGSLAGAPDPSLGADERLDLLLAAPMVTSGDEKVGFRVALSSPSDGTPKLTFYVVREGGQFRLAALTSASSWMALPALRQLDEGDLAGAGRWLDWAREEAEKTGEGDALSAPAIATLWPTGSAPSVETARCAAAALLLGSDDYPRALPLVLACRDREAAAGAAAEPRRLALEVALARTYLRLGRYQDLLAEAQRLQAARPDSTAAFGFECAALDSLERTGEEKQAAERRLAKQPDDAVAIRVLAGVASAANDLDGSARLLQRLVDNGKAVEEDWNNLAWLALFRGKVDDAALDQGQHAATLGNYKSYSALHTLASLYAEQGKTAEAYRLLLQAMDTRSDPSPISTDWYVLGRLAEQYGLPDIARTFYQRVPPLPAGQPDALSTYRLAKSRLQALGAGGAMREAKRTGR